MLSIFFQFFFQRHLKPFFNFAFEAVAVYSPSSVFNAVNIPSGHVSFVCVYYTVS